MWPLFNMDLVADELFVHYDREALCAGQSSTLYDILTEPHLRMPLCIVLVATLGGSLSGNPIKVREGGVRVERRRVRVRRRRLIWW